MEFLSKVIWNVIKLFCPIQTFVLEFKDIVQRRLLFQQVSTVQNYMTILGVSDKHYAMRKGKLGVYANIKTQDQSEKWYNPIHRYILYVSRQWMP